MSKYGTLKVVRDAFFSRKLQIVTNVNCSVPLSKFHHELGFTLQYPHLKIACFPFVNITRAVISNIYIVIHPTISCWIFFTSIFEISLFYVSRFYTHV
jgi:hypothetical protein